MALQVPLITRADQPSDPALACLSMILAYYERPATVEELRADSDAGQATLGGLGLYLLRHGFETEIETLHPRLFTARNRGASARDLIAHLQRRLAQPDHLPGDQGALRDLIRFLEAGGRLAVAIPDERDIREEISNGRPLLATLDVNLLAADLPGHYPHVNTITGIDDLYVYVNDPDPGTLGGMQRYLIADLVYAVHIATQAGLDYGALLKVRHPSVPADVLAGRALLEGEPWP